MSLRRIFPVLFGGGARVQLSRMLQRDGRTVANYQPGIGVTGTLNASAWANQILPDLSGPLLQATGANQPIVLPYSGSKYVYLPAVAGNTLTSPNQTVTGDQTITFNVALNDYTPAADVTLFSKTSGNDGLSVLWLTTDKVRLIVGDGVGLTNVDVVAASSFADGAQHEVTIVWEDGVGATFSYDGVVSGSQVAAVKTLTNAAVALTIGSTTSIGKLYRLQVGSVYDANAADWSETTTNGATQVSSTTGETWTLNNTGAKPAQIVASPQLLGDGTAHFMQVAFTLPTPYTFFFVVKPITFTHADRLFDGGVTNEFTITQVDPTPQMNSADALLATVKVSATLGTWFVITTQQDAGGAAFIQLNNAALATGTLFGNTMTGLTLFRRGNTASGYGNFQVKEIIVRSAADSAATRLAIQQKLAAIHGITL